MKKILVLLSASTTQSRIRKRTVAQPGAQQSNSGVKKSRLAPNAEPTLAEVTSTPSNPIETEPDEANEVVNNKGNFDAVSCPSLTLIFIIPVA